MKPTSQIVARIVVPMPVGRPIRLTFRRVPAPFSPPDADGTGSERPAGRVHHTMTMRMLGGEMTVATRTRRQIIAEARGCIEAEICRRAKARARGARDQQAGLRR